MGKHISTHPDCCKNRTPLNFRCSPVAIGTILDGLMSVGVQEKIVPYSKSKIVQIYKIRAYIILVKDLEKLHVNVPFSFNF